MTVLLTHRRRRTSKPSSPGSITSQSTLRRAAAKGRYRAAEERRSSLPTITGTLAIQGVTPAYLTIRDVEIASGRPMTSEDRVLIAGAEEHQNKSKEA